MASDPGGQHGFSELDAGSPRRLLSVQPSAVFQDAAAETRVKPFQSENKAFELVIYCNQLPEKSEAEPENGQEVAKHNFLH